jgi:hypothetical protein
MDNGDYAKNYHGLWRLRNELWRLRNEIWRLRNKLSRTMAITQRTIMEYGDYAMIYGDYAMNYHGIWRLRDELWRLRNALPEYGNYATRTTVSTNVLSVQNSGVRCGVNRACALDMDGQAQDKSQFPYATALHDPPLCGASPFT